MRSLVFMMPIVALTASCKANPDDRAQPVAGNAAATPARETAQARDAARPRSETRPVAPTKPADSAPGGGSAGSGTAGSGSAGSGSAGSGSASGGSLCVGKWKAEVVKWNPAHPLDYLPGATSFIVVRGPAGYEARRMQGPQDLVMTTRTDTADRCSITVTDHGSDRFTSFHLAFDLEVTKGSTVATGTYSWTDDHRPPYAESRGTFTAKATREPLSRADVAFDPAVAVREFAELWDGSQPLTLKQDCEDLPVMKTRLPREAKVTVGVTATGEISKLVIDGVDQGKLDSVCHFPLWLLQAEPPVLTNRSGVAQIFTADIELR